MAKSLREILRDQEGNLVLSPLTPAATSLSPAGAQSPLAASAEGANPDQAKMAGTPASGGAAPGLGAPTADQQRAPEKLRDYGRTQAPGAEPVASAAENEKQAEGQRLQQQFGDLGSRVQNLIQSYLPAAPAPAAAAGSAGGAAAAPAAGQPAATGGAQVAPTPSTSAQLALTDEAKKLTPAQQTALQAVVASGGSPASIAAAVAAGIPEPAKYLSKDLGTATGQALAQATPDAILLTPDVIQQLGSTPDEMSEALGVPADQLATMSLSQMQDAISARIDAEFSQVRVQAQAAVDPALGPNERALARQELRRAGATGVYATEAQMADLEREIDSAGTIEFAGKSMTVEEFLADDNLSRVARDYVDSPADSQIRKDLREKEPALAAWLDSHEAALREASLQMDEAVEEYGVIQQTGADVVQDMTGLGVDSAVAEQVMKELMPGYVAGQMTEKFDVTQFPGLAAMSDPTSLKKYGLDGAYFGPQFAQVAAMSPAAAAALARMSPAELAKLGFGVRGQEGKVKAYVTYVDQWERAHDLNRKDPEQVIDYIFGTSASVESIQQLLELEASRARLGMASDWYTQMQPLIDRNKDGILDDSKDLYKQITKTLGGDGVSPTGFSAAGSKLLAGSASKEYRPQAGVSTDLARLAADGILTQSELVQADVQRLNYNELENLLSKTSVLDKKARNYIQEQLYSRSQNANLEGALKQGGLTYADVVAGRVNRDNIPALEAALAALDKTWKSAKYKGSGSEAAYKARRDEIAGILEKVRTGVATDSDRRATSGLNTAVSTITQKYNIQKPENLAKLPETHRSFPETGKQMENALAQLEKDIATAQQGGISAVPDSVVALQKQLTDFVTRYRAWKKKNGVK